MLFLVTRNSGMFLGMRELFSLDPAVFIVADATDVASSSLVAAADDDEVTDEADATDGTDWRLALSTWL